MQRHGQPLYSNIQHLGDVVKRNYEQLRLDLPITEPYNHVDLMRRGFFSLLRPDYKLNKENHYPVLKMPEILACLSRDKNTYISQNTFRRPRRLKTMIGSIGLSYLDIDYYKIWELSIMSIDQVIWQIIDHGRDQHIPDPSVIMSSGRGLYLKWYYETTQPGYLMMPRWDKLQHRLWEIYKGFGADRHAIDASRVLRVENTLNLKSGTPCRVIWPDGPEIRKYGFEFLFREVMPVEREALRQRRKERLQNRKVQTAKEEPIRQRGLVYKSSDELNWLRLEDLRKLVAIRGPVPIGQRDTFLFLAVCFSCWTLGFKGLQEEIAGLAQEFCPSLSLKEARTYAGSAIRRWKQSKQGEKIEYKGKLRDPRYTYKNSTLIELLEITEEEQKYMRVIISKEEVRRRRRVKDEQLRRAAGKQIRADYLSGAARRQIEIEQRLRRGYKASVIAKELGIHRSWIYRIAKKCR